jgi:hypothetical protein
MRFRQLRLQLVQSTLQAVVICREVFLDLLTVLRQVIMLRLQYLVLLLQ